MTIVAGFNAVGTPESRNQAVVFGPDGGVALEYDKVHLVPGFERGYRAGTTIGLVGGGVPTTGVAICKDTAVVPIGGGRGTFYSHTGDWFAWLSAAVALAAVAASWKGRPARASGLHAPAI